MRKIVGIMLCSLLVTTCDLLQNDDDKKAKDQKNIALALLAAGGSSAAAAAANVVQNVKATSTASKTVTLTWDPYSGAVFYNIYYTCSTSTQATTVPADTTVTAPTVVATTTGALTSNGATTGTEACSTTVVNIVKGITPTLTTTAATATAAATTTASATVTVANLGLPYKFIVTAVTGATGTTTTETAASTAASLAEVAPTQAQRLLGIYIVGGVGSTISSNVAAVDMYDQDKATWYPAITTLPTPVSFAGVGSEKSKIVVAGGYLTSGALSTVTQVYDIITNSWTNKTAIITNRAFPAVTSLNGKIYFIGGCTAATATTAYAATAVNEAYDVTANTWASSIAIAAANSDRGATQLAGVLYSVGGRLLAATFSVLHDGLVVTPAVPAITLGVEIALPVLKSGNSLVSYYSTTNGGEMWSLGGMTVNTANTSCGVNLTAATAVTMVTTVNSLHAPFQAPQAWTATPPALPTATGYGSAVVDSRNGDVYYAGGNTSSTALTNTGVNTFIKSNIVTKAAWTTLTVMPNARWGHTAIIPNQ